MPIVRAKNGEEGNIEKKNANFLNEFFREFEEFLFPC